MPDPFVFPGEALGKGGQGSDVGLCSSGDVAGSLLSSGEEPSIALPVALLVALPVALPSAFVHLPLLSRSCRFVVAAAVEGLGIVVCLT